MSKTKTNSAKLILAAMGPLVLPMGFMDARNHYFVRPRGNITDVFFFDLLHPDRRSFCIYVGVDVPGWLEKVRESLGTQANPALWVSFALEKQRWYSCFDEQTILRSAAAAVADLKIEALPWLQQLSTPSDVAAEYFSSKVACFPRDSKEMHIGAPMLWALYGFMLLECGDTTKAADWLRSAYTQLTAPMFTDGRKFSGSPFQGGKAMQRSADDRKLAHLIEVAGYAP
jgi:hypothetical protein